MKLLSVFLLCFALLPCAATQATATQPPVTRTTYSTGQALDDALEVYDELASLVAACDQLLNPAALRDIAENITPPCQRLSKLPEEQLAQVCLLADAVLWQSGWMSGAILSEYVCAEDEDASTGFEELAILAASIKRLLKQSLPEETRAALLQLLEPLGGEKALNLPDGMYEQRLAKDVATVLEFLQELCTAVNTPDEATALVQITEAKQALDYLLQHGEIEHLRVTCLTRSFYGSLIANLGCHPFSIPVMPEKLRTNARMQALEPLFAALPELRNLLLEK